MNFFVLLSHLHKHLDPLVGAVPILTEKKKKEKNRHGRVEVKKADLVVGHTFSPQLIILCFVVSFPDIRGWIT